MNGNPYIQSMPSWWLMNKYKKEEIIPKLKEIKIPETLIVCPEFVKDSQMKQNPF